MRVVVQSVLKAAVHVSGVSTASISKGALVFLGITNTDTTTDIDWLARKLVSLRIFKDASGQKDISILDTGGDLILVSQFTLYACTKKGNRPSYIKAARPEVARPLYEQFITALEKLMGKKIGVGVFGAAMEVSLINDGPVTITIDSKEK